MEHQQRKPSISSTQVPADQECSDSRVRVQLVVEDKHQENHVTGLHSVFQREETTHLSIGMRLQGTERVFIHS